MKIAIGNDHTDPTLKIKVKEHLEAQGHEVTDTGCAVGEKCDYPDAAGKVCRLVQSGQAELGIRRM